MKRILTTLAIASIAVFGCKKKDVAPPPTIPLVQTAAITNNGGGNATAGGSVVSDNGATVTKAGVVWSLVNATPTTTDSVVESTTTTGAFTVNINDIDFGKTYYFRAFATNSVGTGYGNVVTLTTSNDSVRFTYNGQSVTYGIIVSPTTGKKWLDRNLGAQQVATAYNDWKAYGDLFQWGRPDDGHQMITWTADNANENTAGTPVNGTTNTLAASDIPGHNMFIEPAFDPPYYLDWRSGNNHNRWATIPQGPCPAGWHVPTIAEWKAEIGRVDLGGTTGGFNNRGEAYNKLKLTSGGYRDLGYPSGTEFKQVGRAGHYWSTSEEINGVVSRATKFNFGFDFAGQTDGTHKAVAVNVRCLKDN